MEKRVTVKDVAEAAGVSVATVSYIINDKPGQKISEATRKKVLQIANLLNYTPSIAAKTLATGKNNIIGVAYKLEKNHPLRNIETSNFINMLVERLNRMNYDVINIPVKSSDEMLHLNQRIDAVIAIDLSDEDFRNLADNYMIPVISVDILVEDFLFYQIYSDIPKAINQTLETGNDICIIIEPFKNKNYMNYIERDFKNASIIECNELSLSSYEFPNNKKIIVVGTYLALILRPYIQDKDMTVISTNYDSSLLPDTITQYSIDLSKKANLTINITLNAIDRKFNIEHKYGV